MISRRTEIPEANGKKRKKPERSSLTFSRKKKAHSTMIIAKGEEENKKRLGEKTIPNHVRHFERRGGWE